MFDRFLNKLKSAENNFAKAISNKIFERNSEVQNKH